MACLTDECHLQPPLLSNARPPAPFDNGNQEFLKNKAFDPAHYLPSISRMYNIRLTEVHNNLHNPRHSFV